MMEDNLRHELLAYSLEELEQMLHRGMIPEHLQEDRKVILATLIEVIKEKKKDQPFYPVF
jgi:hypothetical protein